MIPSLLAFVETEIAPYAGAWDDAQALPLPAIARIGEVGMLGALAPADAGGRGLPAWGELHARVGEACSSVRCLLTVHGMVVASIARWGSSAQRERWLPALAGGTALAAFALTEPAAGSDAAVRTVARRDGSDWILDGTKWLISFGQIADVFLVFARVDDQPTTFLVPRATAGLRATPIGGLLGYRATMPARVELEACRVPDDARLGAPGIGWALVGASALALGRCAVAWGCVGMMRACLARAVGHARERRQFGELIGNFQLVQRRLAEMACQLEAAELLCERATGLLATRSDDGPAAVDRAKYFAARAAEAVTADAVQILGGDGCVGNGVVPRFFRDARVSAVIEGTTEILQTKIARRLLGPT